MWNLKFGVNSDFDREVLAIGIECDGFHGAHFQSIGAHVGCGRHALNVGDFHEIGYFVVKEFKSLEEDDAYIDDDGRKDCH